MDLLLTPSCADALASALGALAGRATSLAAWRRECERRIGTVVECARTSLDLADDATTPGAPPTVPGGAAVRRRAPGVWARGAAPPAGCDAVGMTARARDRASVSVVCRYDVPLDAEHAARRVALLRLLFPVFEAMVPRRFRGRRASGARHPLLSPSVRLLLGTIPDGIACVDDMGRLVWRNEALRRLLAADPEAERMRRAITSGARGLAVRAWGVRRGFIRHDPLDPPASEIRTRQGRYWVRFLCADARDGALIVAVVTRLGVVPDDAVEGLAARYRLTGREAQVARHLVAGRRNAEIAVLLGISPHTARHHTERLLAKLGLTSRGEILHLIAGPRGTAPGAPVR